MKGKPVYHECEIKYMVVETTLQATDRVTLYDGYGELCGGMYLKDTTREITPFILRIVRLMNGYTTQMSKDGTHNANTSRRINTLVLDFIDTWSSWNSKSMTIWEEIYGYKDRLLELKKNYEKDQMLV